MSKQRPSNGKPHLDLIIIGLLIAGVAVSILFEIMGMAIYYRSHGSLSVSADKGVFIHGANLGFLADHLTDMISKQGIDIFLMTMGIIVLIVTPFIRVVVSTIYFALERDVKFFLITLFVLVVLSISLLIH
jgi:uncharacterized membrane protein